MRTGAVEQPHFDNEPEAKAELIKWLSPHFHLFEEVTVSHGTFPQVRIRPDIVAVAKDPRHSDFAIAFEVKSSKHFGSSERVKMFKQASDYVLAKVEYDSSRQELAPIVGKVIAASFVFPGVEPWSYMDAWEGMTKDEVIALVRRSDIFAMAHLAGYLRVGHVVFDERRSGMFLALLFGGNEVFVTDRGWRTDARNMLLGKRQIGSTRKKISDLIGLPDAQT